MPREVRITTPARFIGSGPNSDEYAPLSPFASEISPSRSREFPRPPFSPSTASTTAAMPTSITIP